MEDPVVFISYATPDKTVAGLVCQALEQNRMPCWIAPRNVGFGDNAFSAIPSAIQGCTVLVLVLSSNTSKSKHVSREVQLALDHNKVIIPFRTEDIQPESALAYILTGVQWLDAFVGPVERHLAPLVECVQGVLKVRLPDSSRAPVDYPPIHRANRRWLAWLGGAAAALALLTAGFLTMQRAPADGDDAALHQAVVERLQQSLNGRDIALDCVVCTQQQAHINVHVDQGRVGLSGAAAAKDIASIEAVPLHLPGIKSVSYAVQAIQPVTPSANRAGFSAAPPAKAAVAPQQPNLAPAAASETKPATPEQLRARAYVMTGQENMKALDYISAENSFQMALNLDPGNAAAKTGLAAAKKALGD
jgi:hypothetical protein